MGIRNYLQKLFVATTTFAKGSRIFYTRKKHFEKIQHLKKFIGKRAFLHRNLNFSFAKCYFYPS